MRATPSRARSLARATRSWRRRATPWSGSSSSVPRTTSPWHRSRRRAPTSGAPRSATSRSTTRVGARALNVSGVEIDDEAHAPEHSLEVHVPFLQRALGDFRLLPFVVGRAAPATVAALLDAVWGGPETLVVVSSDLSHYLDHDTATERDRHTADVIVAGAIDSLDPYDACGAYPVRGLLLEAGRKHLSTRLVALCNSGDTAGPRDRVVGYGAFALESEPGARTRRRVRRAERGARAGAAPGRGRDRGRGPADRRRARARPPPGLRPRARCTRRRLRDAGARGASPRLRRRPRARPAAGRGRRPWRLRRRVRGPAPPRRRPRRLLRDVGEGVGALGARATARGRVHRPGRAGARAVDGLVVAAGRHRATLLPSVWHQLAHPADFVAALWQKAGLAHGAWPKGSASCATRPTSSPTPAARGLPSARDRPHLT